MRRGAPVRRAGDVDVWWWKTIRDFFYPPFCIVCDGRTESPGDLVCGACWEAARELTGEPLRIGVRGISVAPRDQGGRGIYARCAHRWNRCNETILHAFKYRDYPNLAAPMAEGLIEMVEGDDRLAAADLVVPVPMAAARRRERGYNQAELLARRLAQATGRELSAGAVRRRRSTRSQTRLSARERRANVRGAFRMRSAAPMAGRFVLVVDDVITTGATAGEVGRLLLGAGARAVALAAVVQAPDPSSSPSR
jgi:ComF family protein